MSKRFNVFGLGNAIVDLQLQVTETELEQLGCAAEKATMRLVEREEQHGLIGSLRDRKARQSSGGSLANSMIALAQLGGKASFAGLVGDDELGRFYTNEMKELGIALEISPNSSLPTGTSAVLITPDAERTMRTYLGASALFSEKDVVEGLLAESSYIFIEGYLFAQEGGRAAVQRAVSLAKKHGVKIAVTVSDAFIVDVFGEHFRPVVEQADMLFANAVEGKKLAGTEDEEEAFAALKKLVPNVAYTRSSKGAWVSLHGEEARVDAYSVKAIDDTGAGDMFAGAFLYGALHGYSAERSARLACFLSSRVVSQFGARLQGDVRRLVQEAEIL